MKMILTPKILIASISTILLITLIAVWFGFYNIAANDKHFDITSSILEVVRDQSIAARSNDIKVPELNDSALIQQGAQLYSEMCTGCHLAPGMAESELNSGLYPQPPVFNDKKYSNKPSAQFWVIKNGIKMTGMPAWAPPHTDKQVWSMVAFINKSNELSPKEYQNMTKEAEGGHGHDGGQGHAATTVPAHVDTPANVDATEHIDNHGDGHRH